MQPMQPTVPNAPPTKPVPVADTLVAAAREHARFALESYSDVDSKPLLTALTAGAAVEAGLKAALARLLPSLLADRGDVHSQLLLAGRGGLPGKTYLDCRTLGPAEAARALALARPAMKLSREDVQMVLSVRNAAAHMGVVRSTDLQEAIRGMVVSVEALLPELGQESSAFWGKGLNAHVAALLQESFSVIAIAVEQAKTVARVRFERLKNGMGPAFEAWAETIDARDREIENDDDHGYGSPHQCPVCGFEGWISGPIARGALQHLPGDRYSEEEHWVERIAITTRFRCNVCGLDLDEEELEVAGLPSEVALDADYDPIEMREMYEDILADEAYERWREERGR